MDAEQSTGDPEHAADRKGAPGRRFLAHGPSFSRRVDAAIPGRGRRSRRRAGPVGPDPARRHHHLPLSGPLPHPPGGPEESRWLRLWCDNWPDRSFKAAREDVLGRRCSPARWRLAAAGARLESRGQGCALTAPHACHVSRRVLPAAPSRCRQGPPHAIGLLPPPREK